MQPERGAIALAAALAEQQIRSRRADRVAVASDPDAVAAAVAGFDFAEPMDPGEVSSRLLELLKMGGVRTDHPRYFGLFNPPALEPAIVGDLIADAINPQLAVWSHAPAAVEIEARLVRLFGDRIWGHGDTAGSFTSGGSEANHTALLSALARRYPEWPSKGVAAVKHQPAIFVSAEAHLAWIKLARAAGLGSDAVVLVQTADGLSLDGAALAKTIEKRDADPLMIVGTAGTTAHGAIDRLSELAEVARAHGTYFHVDAAWGGGALLSRTARRALDGIEEADSVTVDPHKWLSVPMGAGLYVCRSWTQLEAAFDVSTNYMPSASREHRDPYLHSLQWSRRFNGAKLFAALASLGLSGYEQMIDRQCRLGDLLRSKLRDAGFVVLNATSLPLVCFAPSLGNADHVSHIQKEVERSGEAWISTVRLRGELCLRACITSFETTEEDVDALVDLLIAVS